MFPFCDAPLKLLPLSASILCHSTTAFEGRRRPGGPGTVARLGRAHGHACDSPSLATLCRQLRRGWILENGQGMAETRMARLEMRGEENGTDGKVGQLGTGQDRTEPADGEWQVPSVPSSTLQRLTIDAPTTGRPFGYVHDPENEREPPRWLVESVPTLRRENREHHDDLSREQGPYRLCRDETVPRGWAYTRAITGQEIGAVEEALKQLTISPRLAGTLGVDGRLRYRVPGMTEASVGIPYRVTYPDACLPASRLVPAETRLCVHTLETLERYPGGKDVRARCVDLLKACMGTDDQPPLWQFLRRNSRSRKQHGMSKTDPGYWDGSYSLAITVGEGQGVGTLQVASQPLGENSSARDRLAAVVHACADVARFVLRASVSEAEWTSVNHLVDSNNVHGFGGSLFTGLQLNVSSGTFGQLQDSLGHQGGFHLDRHDDPAGYTVFIFCVQHTTGERLPPLPLAARRR